MSDRPKVRTMPISNQQKASAKRLMGVNPRRAVRVGSPGRLLVLALASRREMPPDGPTHPFQAFTRQRQLDRDARGKHQGGQQKKRQL